MFLKKLPLIFSCKSEKFSKTEKGFTKSMPLMTAVDNALLSRFIFSFKRLLFNKI